MRWTLIFFTALASLVLSSQALAMRCGSRLVRDGQTRSQIRQQCGAPDDVIQNQVAVTDAVSARVARYRVGQSVTRVVQVERWVYVQGGKRFPREVVFHDGRVVRVKRLRGR